jgi:hypothetical protein
MKKTLHQHEAPWAMATPQDPKGERTKRRKNQYWQREFSAKKRNTMGYAGQVLTTEVQ